MDAAIAARGIGSPWEAAIVYASSAYGVPVPLIKGVISVESGWNPNAVNPADPSYGLMQINTRAHPDVSPQNALDPAFNITYGTSYLSTQLSRFGLDGGISAYNAGQPISGNSGYVSEVLAYQAWFAANDPGSPTVLPGPLVGDGSPVILPSDGGMMPADGWLPADMSPAVMGGGGLLVVLLVVAGAAMLTSR